MMNSGAARPNKISKHETHLLDAIREVQARVGDGLNDDELTRLLQKTALPVESGFAFLSYCDSFVTLSVPQQDLAAWYPDKRWIAAEKERVARSIAEKYKLSLCEPPDAKYLMFDSPNPHHHLELSNRWETVIIVHPEYLKIRLFGSVSASAHAQVVQQPLFLGANLLQALSTFYQA